MSLIGLITTLSSCSQDEDLVISGKLPETKAYSTAEIQQAKELAIPVSELDNMSEDIKEKRAASIILSDYIKLEGNQYKLAISEQEAQKLGVAPNLYEVIKAEIALTNQTILEYLEMGETIELCDIQSVSKAYKNGKLELSDNTSAYSKVAYPSGTIITTGQEDGTSGFTTEREHTKVLFRCRTAAAPTPIYRCTVTAWGEKKIGSKVGNAITTTEITVPIAASGSGVYATLTFATSDSNGGFCNWQAQ
ncbi:MAG: hypothetical protein K2K25_04620 [Muribaculaceae bacterium]|nr:hypothetical protein [Muribaculaceae bacterium]